MAGLTILPAQRAVCLPSLIAITSALFGLIGEGSASLEKEMQVAANDWLMQILGMLQALFIAVIMLSVLVSSRQ